MLLMNTVCKRVSFSFVCSLHFCWHRLMRVVLWAPQELGRQHVRVFGMLQRSGS